MTIPVKDKARGKRRILKEIEPWLLDQGFIKNPKTGYHLSDEKGSELVMVLNVPSFEPRYRVFSYVQFGDSRKPITAPDSFSYECPNLTGSKRYNMRFHIDDETHARCIKNLKEWILEVLIPWFKDQPKESWTNPNIIKG